MPLQSPRAATALRIDPAAGIEDAIGLGSGQRPAAPQPGFVERRKAVRRRGNGQQGRALEKLGHAVEYLMNSRLFLVDTGRQQSEQEALRILMRMSRLVFLECPQVVSIWDDAASLCRRSFARK